VSEQAPGLIAYGGAFDPPHAGHVACVALARAAFPAARLKIVPGFNPAVAGGAAKPTQASFAERVAMCRLAFPDAEVDGIEERLPTPNYTYRTLEALAAAEPGVRLAWLLGSDQLKAFGSWRHPQAILELADLVVVTRPGMVGSTELPSGLRGTVHLVGAADWPAASQRIRACLSGGEPVPHGWLPEAVARYLDSHRPYGKKEGP
jgi:nicotinate-nucleotide adenylyltransferase